MNAMTPATSRSALSAPILQPQTFDQLVRFAEMAAQSDLMPKDYKGKPANIMLAVQMGSELGLAPMQSIQNISIINGRPSVWGDAMLALCKGKPHICQDVNETITGDGDSMVATCTALRVGAKPVVSEFSVADAKKAQLWTKQGPWVQYPKRMLQMRARGFALRDAFPDILKGMLSVEEARDTPAEPAYAGTTIDGHAQPPAPARPAPPADLPALQTDRLRDLTDDFVVKLAAKEACADVRAMATWAETEKGILSRVREARRPDLDTMLCEAIAAARLRCPEPAAAAEPDAADDGWPGPDVPAHDGDGVLA